MEPLIIFNFVYISILRIVGISVQVDFFLKKKSIRPIYFIIMWSCFLICEFMLIVNAYLHSLLAIVGFTLGIIGIISYFIEIKKNRLIETLGIVILFYTVLFFFISVEIAQNFAVIVFFVALMTQIISPLLKFSEFKKQIAKSIGWYYGFVITNVTFLPISFYYISQGSIIDIYSLEDVFLIIMYFGGQFATQLILLIFTIHIEHNHSMHANFKLKDMYSHDLGNIIQTIQLGIDLVSHESANKEEKDHLLETMSKKCKESSDLIKKIRDLQE